MSGEAGQRRGFAEAQTAFCHCPIRLGCCRSAATTITRQRHGVSGPFCLCSVLSKYLNGCGRNGGRVKRLTTRPAFFKHLFSVPATVICAYSTSAHSIRFFCWAPSSGPALMQCNMCNPKACVATAQPRCTPLCPCVQRTKYPPCQVHHMANQASGSLCLRRLLMPLLRTVQEWCVTKH